MSETAQKPATKTSSDIKKVIIVWGILLVISMAFLYALSFLLPTLAQLAVQKDPTNNNAEGIRAMSLGDFEAARKYFEESLQQDPDQDQPHFRLALILRKEEDLENALKHVNTAIEKNSSDVEFRLLRSTVLAEMQRYDEAVEAASEALKYAPNSDEVYLKLGHVNSMAGNTEAAEQAFYKSLALNPDNQHAERGLAMIYIGRGELAKALPSWKRLTTRFPTDAEYHYYYGACLVGTGETQKGIQEMKMAKSLDPEGFGAMVDARLKKIGQ